MPKFHVRTRIHGRQRDHEDRDDMYMAAWNEPMRPDALLSTCWSDGGVYLDPKSSLTGRTALAPHRHGSGQPARRAARFMSGIDVHHNVVRFLWRLVRRTERAATFDRFWRGRSDGRLVKIIGFLCSAPAS
jgi:hypothetical protein